MQACIGIMKMQFTIWGHTISLWQVGVFNVVAAIIGTAIADMFYGGDN